VGAGAPPPPPLSPVAWGPPSPFGQPLGRGGGAGGGGGGAWGSPPPPSPLPQTRQERGARRPTWLVICGRSARLWSAAASGSAVAAGLAGVPRPHALVGPPTRAGCWRSRMVAVKVDLPTPSGLLPGLARLALTAVLPKIPHCNSSKSFPNRPLRGRRGRFGTLLQGLECGIFGRAAGYPHRRLGRVLRPLTRATPAHIYRACPKRSSTRRPADAPRAAPVLPLCPHRPPAVHSRHDIAALAASVHVNRHRDGRPAAPGHACPRGGASHHRPTGCRFTAVSARHVRPAVAFEPRIQMPERTRAGSPVRRNWQRGTRERLQRWPNRGVGEKKSRRERLGFCGVVGE